MATSKKVNEKEQVDALHAALKSKGIEVTKTLLDEITDVQNDLAFATLSKGIGMGFQGVGSIVIAEHKERAYKVPDGKGGFHEGITPAGHHVVFIESNKLSEKLAEL